MPRNPQEVLAAGRLIARNAAPYFRAKLLSFVTRAAPGLGTVACTKRGIFLYDPEAISGWSAEQMAGAWVHEVMHSILKHHDRGFGKNPELLNMAQDLAINPAVLDMGLQLPEGGLFPEKFGWQRGLTSEEYYDLLLNMASAASAKQAGAAGKGGSDQQGGSGGDDDGDEDQDGDGGGDAENSKPGDPGSGKGRGSSHGPSKPHAGGGWCGSCAARPLPNEPADDDPDARSEAEIERVNRQTAENIRSASSKDRGTMPAGLLKWAEAELEPPTIPWQAKLSRATRNAATWAAGAVDHRYDQPGRRQAGIGYGPGRPVLPRLRRPIPRVAIAIDTSGSMGPAETFAAVQEVQGVLRAVNADVTFCACDAAVHALAPIRQLSDLATLLKGGGGTDFCPVFEALDKARPRPEVVIFMTDGYGPAPEHPPVGMRVIWVLVGRPARVPFVAGGAYGAEVAYGEQIEIPLE